MSVAGMGDPEHADLLSRVFTVGVVKYLKMIAREHIEGYDEEEEDLPGDRDAVWEELDGKEKDTANHVVQEVFGDWL